MTTTTVGLLLHPLDMLFFRDGRPFGPRDSGHSILPTPQTLAGMIKTHLMRTAGLNPRQLRGLHRTSAEGGNGHWLGSVRTRGPWLYRGAASGAKAAGAPLVAVPANLVGQGKRGEGSPLALAPLENAPPGWPMEGTGLRPLWSAGPGQIGAVSGWLDQPGLEAYLHGKAVGAENICQAEDLFDWVDRTGIAVDRATATAQDGAIYSTRMLALKPGVSFYAQVELPATAPAPQELFPKALCLPWGGEGRRVNVELLAAPFAWPLVPPKEGRMLSLLITPGIFSNGQYPWRPRERGTLIAAAMARPLAVSGWDLAGSVEGGREPGPRPTRFAVPAGAVYFWSRSEKKESTGTTDEPQCLDTLVDRPRDADAGWGMALCGSWNYFRP